jgi:hypothetical protein
MNEIDKNKSTTEVDLLLQSINHLKESQHKLEEVAKERRARAERAAEVLKTNAITSPLKVDIDQSQDQIPSQAVQPQYSLNTKFVSKLKEGPNSTSPHSSAPVEDLLDLESLNVKQDEYIHGAASISKEDFTSIKSK